MEELEKRVRRMSGFRTRSEVLPVGYVLSVGDGIAHVSGPVSYTHLDVYKRQAWSTPPFPTQFPA